MDISLVIYSLFFLIILLFSYFLSNAVDDEKKKTINLKGKILYINKKSFLFTMAILLVFASFSGVRENVGTDYNTYKNIYYECLHIDNIFLHYLKTGTEIGFIIICKIADNIFNDYHGMFFLIALLIGYFTVKSLKRFSVDGSFVFMIFIFLVIYLAPSFNIVRQILAASIIFYGYKYVEEREILKYIIMILLASLIHISALFCVPVYFLFIDTDKVITKREIILIGCIACLPLLFNALFKYISYITLFNRYVNDYQNMISYQENWGTVILHLPIMLMIFFNWKKLIKFNRRNKFYLLLFILEMSCIILGFYMHWAMRMGYYFMFSEVILIPEILRLKKGILKLLMSVIIIFYYLLYFYAVFYVWGDNDIFPYITFLSL